LPIPIANESRLELSGAAATVTELFQQSTDPTDGTGAASLTAQTPNDFQRLV
jgi:hypothetical protein